MKKKLTIEEQLEIIKKVVHDPAKEVITLHGKSISLPELRDFKLSFGKYQGQTLKKIARNDLNYLNWLRNQPDVSEALARKLGAAVYADKIGKL